VIVLAVLCGRTVSLPRKIFGPKRDELIGKYKIAGNEELRDPYRLYGIVRMVNFGLRRIDFLFGLGKRKLVGGVEIYLGETCCENGRCLELAQGYV
jgi:hypothetical protein